MKITEHFTVEEFERSETATRLHIDNRIPEALKPRIRVLCERVLEPVRREFGAVRITSGYRCPALNEALRKEGYSSSKTSQHMKGEAADIIVPSLWGKSEGTECAHRVCVRGPGRGSVFSWMMENLEFDQLIWERSWIHVSFREGRNRQEVLYR